MWLQVRLHASFPWIQSFPTTAHTELRETCLPVYYVTTDSIKDTDEQPDEEVHRAGSRKGPGSRRFCLHEVEYPHSLRHVGVFTNLKLLEPVPWGFLWRLQLILMHHYLSVQPLSSSWRMGGGWKFQDSTHGLIFLVTPLHPRALQVLTH